MSVSSGKPNIVRIRSTHIFTRHVVYIYATASRVLMLKQLHCTENPDLTVEKYGTLRNRSGVKLRLSNVEFVSDDVLAHWHRVMGRHGFSCKVEYDASTQVVTIVGREQLGWSTWLFVAGACYIVGKMLWHFV